MVQYRMRRRSPGVSLWHLERKRHMPFDGLFAAAVRRQLADALIGARVDKIYQPTPNTVILHCWRPGENVRLLLSADPGYPRVHLTRSDPPNPLQPPTFCMVLRKHLDPGKIADVQQMGRDRVLHVVIDGYDENGKPARRRLIAELTGRNSNLILVDDAGVIVDALRRASADVNSYRTIMPGELYVPPPATGKLDPGAVTPAELAEQAQALTDRPTWARFLTAVVEGVSPLAAAHIATSAALAPDAPLEPSDEKAFARVAHVLAQVTTAAEEGAFSPVVLTDDAGFPADFWAWRPSHVAADRLRAASDPSAAADEFFRYRTALAAEQQLRTKLTQAVRTALKRLQRKAEALRGDLEDARQADQYRLYGELLTASLHMVKQGPSATVPNYYENGAPIVIPLDPALSPAANAQRYFKRYNKAKTARSAVKAQLDAVETDIAYLEQVLMHVETAPGVPELREIEAELQAAGVMTNSANARQTDGRTARREKATNRPQRTPSSRPLQTRASDGSVIFVGRSNRQNDGLTLHTARPDDIWLHVKNLPGAHVVLQPAGGEPSEQALMEAAELAAYFSRARTSSNVAVDWTRARYVRKPKGARPGMVVYDHHQTIFVTPDERRIQQLLGRERPSGVG